VCIRRPIIGCMADEVESATDFLFPFSRTVGVPSSSIRRGTRACLLGCRSPRMEACSHTHFARMDGSECARREYNFRDLVAEWLCPNRVDTLYARQRRLSSRSSTSGP
jgi:hypothetical protein